jgi:tRNA modification GTPase
MPFSATDTIVAIATPPGRGGIGVVRLSGADAHVIARGLIAHREPLEPRHATFTKVRLRPDPTAAAATPIDHVIATFFPAPASYTGDDVVELSAHGSPVVLRAIVASALELGARLAEPGEFTLRAFLNGRLDLMQAEAVADLIDAVTPLQARVAFDQLDGTLTRSIAEIDAALFDLVARLEASVDFPDEGYHFVDPAVVGDAVGALLARTSELLATARRGRLVRDGLTVAIVGAPNVGKSSLFNALLGAARAIVADVPGTTRDMVTDVLDLDGLRVTLVDTAGLRETENVVEAEGVARSRQAMVAADLVLHVFDAADGLPSPGAGLIIVNKSDLITNKSVPDSVVRVSALTGDGLDELRRRIVEAIGALDVDNLRDRPAITNVRHIALVQRAHDALARAQAAVVAAAGSLSEEFVLADLQDARGALEEISGRRAPEELLKHIFARFCVGK